jgi:hypothetical protein
MPTNYPANLDTWPTIGPLLSSTPHSEVHEDLQDAVEAIQTELGTTPSGPASTVRANLEQLRRTYANTAALPGSGEFTGQRVWVTDEFREYAWDGTHWRITAGVMPRARFVRKTTHSVTTGGSQILLSGHTGEGTFRTGDILTIPAGAGGLYQLDFGGRFDGSTTDWGRLSVTISPTSGTYSWEDFSPAAGGGPGDLNLSYSRILGIGPNRTLTLAGSRTSGATGPTMSYIGLTMLQHLPALT